MPTPSPSIDPGFRAGLAPGVRFRLLHAAALLLCVLLTVALPVRAQVTVTDLAGRSVHVPAKLERILLGEGRLLPALAVLEPGDPTTRLVGMMGDFEQLDPAGYAPWRARFPRLDKLPRVGRTQSGSFSDERALQGQPQLAIFGLGGGHGPGERDRETLARLEAAGVAVVFVDFRHDPLGNTPRSMQLLGEVLGRREAAAAFNAYWQSQLQLVQQRLAARKPVAPAVFLEDRVGLGGECCATMVGLLGTLVEAAGGRNVARGMVPGEHGTLNPELLLARQPEVYIGTAIGSTLTQQQAPQRIALGTGVTPALARDSLRHALQRPQLAPLKAVQQGRAHAIWHHFYNSPFNVAAVQAMAKWLHPTLFADLDPRQTLQEMHRRFQPVALQGEYWVSMER